MADRVFGFSPELLLNRFFDPSTTSMRKVDDGEEKKIMTFIVASNVIAS